MLFADIRIIIPGPAFLFRVGVTTVGKIVAENVIALWKEIHEEHMLVPTKESFKLITEDFYNQSIMGGICRGARCLTYPAAPLLAVTPRESPCRVPAYTE